MNGAFHFVVIFFKKKHVINCWRNKRIVSSFDAGTTQKKKKKKKKEMRNRERAVFGKKKWYQGIKTAGGEGRERGQYWRFSPASLKIGAPSIFESSSSNQINNTSWKRNDCSFFLGGGKKSEQVSFDAVIMRIWVNRGRRNQKLWNKFFFFLWVVLGV